jgi:PAS domain S-box-containing protein
MKQSRILIADDEPLNLMLYAEIFKNFDYLISTASDGLEAVNKSVEELPELILLDWNMPRLDGLEALKRIKANPATQHIPAIMITGIMTSPENLKTALEAGAIDFIRKPFDRIELMARVKSMLLLSSTMTELQNQYRRMEQSNRFIHTLIESLPQPMVFYTLDGKIAGLNRKFLKMLNKEEADHIGDPIEFFLSPEESLMHKLKDKELIESKSEIVYECTKGEPRRDYVVSKNLLFDHAGIPSGILMLMTDVTEINQTHHEMVKIKKRELASNALRLVQMKEMNNHLIEELYQIREYTNEKGQSIIRSLINRFNLDTGDNLWNEFEMHFSNVNELFYKKLQSEFPDLTPNEKKLCALLRLNLSSKDIASITSQNPQSIDVARYRLRKKLNLTGDENLVDFLMRF